MRYSLVFIFSLVGFVTASQLSKRWEDLEVKHAWAEIPYGWELHSAAPPDYTLDMRIGLKQDRFDQLVEQLYEVSDPTHQKYGAHLSKEDIDALVAPHPETVDVVDAWLRHHGINPVSVSRSGAGDWLSLTVPVAQAERMLDSTYHVYYNAAAEKYAVCTQAYSLPAALHPHITVVTPTTYFGSMSRMESTSVPQTGMQLLSGADAVAQYYNLAAAGPAAVPASCNFTVTPACLRALYNTTAYTPQATKKNILGVTGYLNEFANHADLQTFFASFRPDAENATFTTITVNGGGDNQSQPGIEANLDIQYAEAISFPTPIIYYSTGGSPPFKADSITPTDTNEPYLDWLHFILAQHTIPQTITTSYGDDEQTVPLDYAISVCNLFAQLGARGSSILFSSGDAAVGGGSCATNDGTNTTRFQPVFPASCPFVTAVGATARVSPEIAIDFSGGGFSNYFARPSYQAAAVSNFLEALGNTNAGLFDKAGRAYPDVAAQGQRFEVVIGGGMTSQSGTSASTPTFAAIISLLNDFRISHGKAPLGFLNPLLYTHGVSGLNDITSGSNPGCGTEGFTARAGWDPVTGLGTPDFGKLQDIVRKL